MSDFAFVPRRKRAAAVLSLIAMTKRLHREFGLLVGTSSGANVVAALKTAGELGVDRTVTTLLCDRAERYFSTALFAQGK
ncbi:MAG: hypothetical protein EHM42_11365 [Planctomycetaceae bacterium]|nr:MAG: hypothetical protein EHM42_11365 [Planctomycetaceae bacterium]